MEDKYFRVMGTVLLISVAFFIIAKLNFGGNYSVTVGYYSPPSETSYAVGGDNVTVEGGFGGEELVPQTKATEEVSIAEVESETAEIDVSFPLDLNHITYEELLLVPNIGHVTATRIVQYRDYLGGYSNLEQLMEIKGIGETTFQDISSFLYVE